MIRKVARGVDDPTVGANSREEIAATSGSSADIQTDAG